MNDLFRSVLHLGAVIGISSQAIISEGSKKIRVPSADCDENNYPTMGAHIVPGYDMTRSFCNIRLQTDYGAVFMVKYDRMNLACGQTIKVYFSSHAEPERLVRELDCNSDVRYLKPDYGTYRYLYVTFQNVDRLNGQVPEFDFSLVISSVLNAPSFDLAHCLDEDSVRCRIPEYNQWACLHDSLRCNGVSNCPRNEDEDGCVEIEYADSDSDSGSDSGPIGTLGSHSGVLTGIVVAVVVGLVVVTVCVIIIACVIRRKRNRSRARSLNPAVHAVAVYQPPSAGTAQPQGQSPAPYTRPSNITESSVRHTPPQPPGGYQTVPTAPPAEECINPPSYDEVCPPSAGDLNKQEASPPPYPANLADV